MDTRHMMWRFIYVDHDAVYLTCATLKLVTRLHDGRGS